MSKINIYWAPSSNSHENNWNILYEDPQNLYSEISNSSVPPLNKNGNFLRCPSFKSYSENIYIIKNPIETEFSIENDKLNIISKNLVSLKIRDGVSPINNYLIQYEIPYIFFSEENVEMSITSPFFHKCEHIQYANVVPGKFNISKWFRQTNIEFNLYENYMKIKEDEPIMYVNFNSNNTVQLKRFNMTDTLNDISKTIGSASKWERGVSLKKRYSRFTNSKTNKLVIKEIKKNLID